MGVLVLGGVNGIIYSGLSRNGREQEEGEKGGK